MHKVIVHNLSNPQVRPLTAIYCASFLCRLRGLMFRFHLDSREGLLLVEKGESRLRTAIHMLGVWISLAVAWINDAGLIVDVRLARPWRFVYIPQRPARFVLEMSAERMQDFRVGDYVVFEETSVD